MDTRLLLVNDKRTGGKRVNVGPDIATGKQ